MKRFGVVAVLVIFAFSLHAGCATFKGETTGEYVDDATITTQANAAILQDPDAHFFKIDVTTTNGDVVLTGYVNNRDTENRIVSKIQQVRGVRSVKSLLKIERR